MSPQARRAAPTSSSDPSSAFADAVERAASSVVAIHARRRIPSSGIVWRDGVIVSANHTVNRDDDITITLPSGESAAAAASVVGRDAASDLVVLRLKSDAPPAHRADPKSLRVGALVLAVGRPGSHATASLGIVRAITEGWRGWNGTKLDRAARLDLAVYDGFSGGALVDSSGALLGVNNSALARGSATALPVPVVDRIVDELLSHGHVPRPFLGIAVQPVTLLPSQAEPSGEREARTVLLVSAVGEGSPAERAGVIVGDVLLSAAGRTLRRPTDLLDALAESTRDASGKDVPLVLLRGGKSVTIAVTPADRRATA
jgi:S1-C subfamily serine protease